MKVDQVTNYSLIGFFNGREKLYITANIYLFNKSGNIVYSAYSLNEDPAIMTNKWIRSSKQEYVRSIKEMNSNIKIYNFKSVKSLNNWLEK